MKKYSILLLLLSFHLSAQTLCERIDNGISNYLDAPESRLSFRNHGGLFNGGVCWWHSRLQRSSAYLLEFKPDLPRPTSSQLQTILFQLKDMNKVVIVPGFENFNTFSKEYEKEMQTLLEYWQKEDGFINQEWIRGISGQYELAPADMKIRMDTLHEQFLKSPHPIWVMAQIKGVTSHAFLIVDMIPIENGYELNVIDSNYPMDHKVISYQMGDRFLKHAKDKFSFVPYLGFQRDFALLQASSSKYCGKTYWNKTGIPMGDIEVSPKGSLK